MDEEQQIREAERQRLDLIGQCLLMESESSFLIWKIELTRRFGVEIGEQLSEQRIAVGMRVRHLLACFGPPDQKKWQTGILIYYYGMQGRGSYFELQRGIITKVEIMQRPPLPIH